MPLPGRKSILDFNEARDDGVQWHQLNHMQIICTSLQTNNLTTELLQAGCPSAAQPTASKHRRQKATIRK